MSNVDQVFGKQGDSSAPVVAQGDSQVPQVNALGKAWGLDEAANKITHAENHIKQLEKELEDARAKSAEAAKFDDVLEALQSKVKGDNPVTAAVDPDDLVRKTLTALEQRELERKARENFDKTEQLMKQKYGEDYKEKAVKEASDKGLSPKDLKGLMESSPVAIARLLQLDDQRNPVNPISGGFNTTKLATNSLSAEAQSAAIEAKDKYLKSRSTRDLDSYVQSKFKTRS